MKRFFSYEGELCPTRTSTVTWGFVTTTSFEPSGKRGISTTISMIQSPPVRSSGRGVLRIAAEGASPVGGGSSDAPLRGTGQVQAAPGALPPDPRRDLSHGAQGWSRGCGMKRRGRPDVHGRPAPASRATSALGSLPSVALSSAWHGQAYGGRTKTQGAVAPALCPMR